MRTASILAAILACAALVACAQEIPPQGEAGTAASLQSLEQYQQGSSYALNCGVSGFTPNSYEWDFGDGTKRTTEYPGVAHTYSESGTYLVTCQATDGTLTTASNMTLSVTVEPAQITESPASEPDLLGDLGNLTDIEDVALDVPDLPDIDWDDSIDSFDGDEFTLTADDGAGTGTGSISSADAAAQDAQDVQNATNSTAPRYNTAIVTPNSTRDSTANSTVGIPDTPLNGTAANDTAPVKENPGKGKKSKGKAAIVPEPVNLLPEAQASANTSEQVPADAEMPEGSEELDEELEDAEDPEEEGGAGDIAGTEDTLVSLAMDLLG